MRTVTKCKPKRTVVLKRIQEGLDPVVGRDTTNRAGEWRVDEPAARGRYYAKVFKRVFTTNDVKNVCQPARSKTVSTNS